MPTATRADREAGERHGDRAGLGILLMLVAAVFATSLSASAKWLLTELAWPALQVVALRYAVHFAMACAIFLPKQGVAVFRANAPGRLLLRSLVLILATLLNFLALQHLPLTLTTVILFAGPILITVLSVPMLGERIGAHRLVAVLVGFCGVLVVIQPGSVGFDPAVLYSVGSMGFASLYYILTRMLAGVDSNASIQLWSSGLASVVFLPLSLGTWVWPESGTALAVVLFMGVCGGLSHIASTGAHQLARASMLAPFTYAQIVTASAAGYLLFGERPGAATLVGCAIIIGSGLYLWWRETRLS